MSRPEIIKQLKKKYPELNRFELETIINIFIANIENALESGRNIQLRDLGNFFIKKIKEKYSARNPKTGELIYVPEKNKVGFKASKKLKKLINE